MFFHKPKPQNTFTTLVTQIEKRVLCQLFVKNIKKNSEKVLSNKNRKAIELLLHYFFEQTLQLILVEKQDVEENSDPKDPL